MKRAITLAALTALAALFAAVPALAQESGGVAATERAAARTPVTLRFVLKEELPKGADLTIFYDTPRRAQAAYYDCQLGAGGVPDPEGRCGPGRYEQEVAVREGQRIRYEFAVEFASGRTRVVKEGSRVVGDEPLLVRAVYPEAG